MQWLDAVLTFAITMLILSMITTTLVETLHRVFALRWRGLRRMLARFYEDEVWPLVKQSNADLWDLGTREQFLQTMLLNRTRSVKAGAADPSRELATIPTKADVIGDFFKTLRAILHWIIPVNASRQVNNLPKEEFIKRLGASAFAAPLARVLKDQDDKAVLNIMGEKYDAYGKDASVSFERRARIFSVSVAIVVAWIFYVHPYELLTTYLQKPAITEKVIALGPQALKDFESYEKQLKEAKETLGVPDESEQAANGSEEKKPAAEAAEKIKKLEEGAKTIIAQAKEFAASFSGNDEFAVKAKQLELHLTQIENGIGDTAEAIHESLDQAAKAVKDVKAAIADAKEEAGKLKLLGVPLGWTQERITEFDPVHVCLNSPWPVSDVFKCAEGKDPEEEKVFTLYWPKKMNGTVLWLLLGGFLVGLGAPFWARTVKSITQLRGGLKSITDAVGPKKDPNTPQTEAVRVSADRSIDPSTPAGLFELTRKAEAAKNSSA